MSAIYLNPIEQLYKMSQELPNKIYLRQPIDKIWKEYTFKDAYFFSEEMAGALSAAGLKGEKIAILSKNCAHWLFADFATWMSGAVSVPLLPTYSQTNLEKIISHSGVKLIFCGKLDNWKQIQSILPKDVTLLSFPDFPLEGTISWDDFIAQNPNPEFTPLARKPEELATITYTSGSTGMPKGVMHDFAAVSFTGYHVAKIINFNTEDHLISYLPIAHVAERALSGLGPVYGGSTVSFVKGLDTFSQTLKDVEPTIFLAMPRIWQKMQEGVLKKLPQKKLDLLLSLPIVSTFIKRKIKKQMGLANARYFLSGAAPMLPSVTKWFRKIDIVIREGYGMTETFAYAHFSLQKVVKDGAVGKALDGVDSKLSESGELLIKSPSNMLGFYNDPEQSKEAFTEEGYLRTGDLGAIDSDGFLYITGRCKELFKTSKGKYIVPNQLEAKLHCSDWIDQICVMGAGMEAPYAVLTLTQSLSTDKAEELKAQVTKDLTALLRKVNSALESHEKISKLLISQESWSVENGLMTPTLKIKRTEVEKYYSTHVLKYSSYREKIVIME